MQIFTESRKQPSFGDKFEIFKKITALIEKYDKQEADIELQAINRKSNGFFYEIQSQLENVQIISF